MLNISYLVHENKNDISYNYTNIGTFKKNNILSFPHSRSNIYIRMLDIYSSYNDGFSLHKIYNALKKRKLISLQHYSFSTLGNYEILYIRMIQ